MIAASLKNYRVSPRKVRLVARLIQGKSAIEADYILVNAAKKAGEPIRELLASATANARNNFSLEKDGLFVKEIRVDQGQVLKRHRPVSRGSAHPIKKRTSHVSIVLAPIEKKAAKNQKPKTNNR